MDRVEFGSECEQKVGEPGQRTKLRVDKQPSEDFAQKSCTSSEGDEKEVTLASDEQYGRRT